MNTKSNVLHIVASYDISDPKRLTKVAKAMKAYGERVLKSVFECNLDQSRFEEMKGKIDEIIEPIEDSVRYYLLCEKCVRGVEYCGKGEVFQEDEEYLVV
jgi:CRISPR-associated protein Cas2